MEYRFPDDAELEWLNTIIVPQDVLQALRSMKPRCTLEILTRDTGIIEWHLPDGGFVQVVLQGWVYRGERGRRVSRPVEVQGYMRVKAWVGGVFQETVYLQPPPSAAFEREEAVEIVQKALAKAQAAQIAARQ
jgi:hypothetical protein